MTDISESVRVVSAALLSSDREHRQLLHSVVTVARVLFSAWASSIFLLDESDETLVFEAVSGEGEDFLVGNRFPAGRGIAGWVLSSGQPLIVQDLTSNPIFAQDIAESTSYVPKSMLAAPLLYQGEAVGVIEVLDPSSQPREGLEDLELLSLFAEQAAIALQIVRRSRSAGDLFGGRSDYRAVVGIVTALGELEGPHRAAGYQLIEAMRGFMSAAGHVRPS